MVDDGRCAAAPVNTRIPVEIGHRRDLLRESKFIFEIGFTGRTCKSRPVTARARLAIHEMDLGKR